MSICPHCGFRVFLGDRYRAIQLLGKGASGRTWLVIDDSQSSPGNTSEYYIAQQSPRSADPLSLFQNSQLWYELGHHPQLPTLLDCFEQDSYWYGVQTYIPGESLTRMLARGRLNSSDLWGLLDSLLPVLQFIHSQGVIHRDIKPDTILRRFSPQGSQNGGIEDWVLVDFKAAIVFPNTAPCSRQTIVGDSAYAAPEQMRGQATVASDLYSLGVTCIHLLTDMHPFHLMDAATHTWVWQSYGLPESGHTVERLEHQYLAQLIDRLIAPDLTQRFGSAAEAIATLHKLRGKRSAISNTTPSIQPSRWSCYATLAGHQGLFANVNAVAIAPDNRTVASASDDKTIRLWNGQTGTELDVLQGHSQFVTAIAFHPHNSELLVSGSRDRTIKLWHWPDRREIRSFTGHGHGINTVLITPDGQELISGSADKTVKLWEVDSGKLLASLTGHRLAVNAVAYQDSVPGYPYPVLATASTDTTVKLWNLKTSSCIHTLAGHTAAVRAIAFHPSAPWLATAGEDGTIRLWNMASRQCTHVLSGHSWAVSTLLFTADGDILISSSDDKTIKLWQVSTGQVIETLVGHTDAVSGVAIAPNQHIMASSSHDKTVKLWSSSSTSKVKS